MASTPAEGRRPLSAWARLMANVAAVAQAMELDRTEFLDARIKQLERRIAALEAEKVSTEMKGT